MKLKFYHITARPSLFHFVALVRDGFDERRFRLGTHDTHAGEFFMGQNI